MNQPLSATPVASIAPADLHDFIRSAGMRAGLPADAAAMLAEPLVLADMMGVHTHGTKLLPGYIRKLIAGGYRPQAVPRVVREGPAWAVVDGEAALGQVGCTTAMRLAIAKAKQTGVATVASARASGAPTQKWMPCPKAMWRLGWRRTSKRSGSAKWAGSRLAAFSIWNTMSPCRMVRPPSSTSAFMRRDCLDTGLSYRSDSSNAEPRRPGSRRSKAN